jgi:C-terminal processing protease CtpA/Prc
MRRRVRLAAGGRVMRVWRIAAAAALLACAATAAPAQTRAPPETQRLAELGRLWVYFEFFNAYPDASGAAWDAALIEAIPAVRRARSEAQYVEALNALLRRTGDPSARILTEEGESRPETTPTRVQDGAAIANCSTIAAAQDVSSALAELAQAPRGAVLDCRDFEGGYARTQAFASALAMWRAGQALPGGATMVRSYSGFPPEFGASGGGYSSGLSMVQEPALAPGRGAEALHPLVIMIDAEISLLLPTLAALQAAGKVRLVSEGDVGSGSTAIDLGARHAVMSRGVYVYPDGSTGFRPDAPIPAGDDAAALRIALEQLDAPRPSAAAAQARASSAALRRYEDDAEVPPVEARLLALYRLWGTIQYFFPYRDLADQPWNDALAEFIPVFIAADTRAAYETALLRLTARMQDSHAGAANLRATLYGAAPHAPNITTRYVEGRLAVTDVKDATLRGRIAVGDEILAVDGAPVARIEARLTPLIAHSTPQSLRRRLAFMVVAGPANSEAELRLRGSDGRTRTVRVPRVEWRPPIPDAPVWSMLDGEIGYIDLERLTSADANRALDEVIEARALILDLRGYPQGAAWIIAPRLARRPEPVVAARFRRPLYVGPPRAAQETWAAFDQTLPPVEPGRQKYEGPVFVLIDEHAISQSEHSGLFLEAAADATFVGSPTEGANGDLTWFTLPGGLSIRFTGHDVSWPDGRQLQRVGLQPDVAVSPTIAGLRAGRDEVLEAALELARRGVDR